MIYDSTKFQEEKVESNPHNIYVLFTLAVATSIDALAAGITFSCLNYNIWEAAAIIGIITFILSFIGAQLGKTLGHHLGEYKIEILGGIILIGIGVKIVLERVL
jgi:putative Mn2+ efflux pump MntP